MQEIIFIQSHSVHAESQTTVNEVRLFYTTSWLSAH